jgi:hypothetical protein
MLKIYEYALIAEPYILKDFPEEYVLIAIPTTTNKYLPTVEWEV